MVTTGKEWGKAVKVGENYIWIIKNRAAGGLQQYYKNRMEMFYESKGSEGKAAVDAVQMSVLHGEAWNKGEFKT